MKTIRVAELFAGVGGFRVGFERASKHYDTVWFNQWEPGKADSSQHAWATYCRVFGHDSETERSRWTNTDISKVPVKDIPDHDLLVGGFPCQDYSVARTLNQAAGLVGKKGVLWWEIYRILREKGKKAPKYLMLENVDRLLKSPVSKRGKDFAIMLSSLAELGYAVEWRVINAADYGMPQRRRRVYILGYKKGTSQYEEIKADQKGWLSKKGVMPKAFPVHAFDSDSIDPISLPAANDVEKELNFSPKASIFHNAGVMVGGKVLTVKTLPAYEGDRTLLKHVVIPENKVPEEYFIPESRIEEWKRQKGGKTEERESKDGFKYSYSEGSMAFPDPLDKPSRTVVTGEGGSGASRFKHVVRTKSGRLRRLTPLELERLNMFPDGHTEGASDNQRAFFMGNALVVGIVERLGKELIRRADG